MTKSVLNLRFMQTECRFFSGDDAFKYKNRIRTKIAGLSDQVEIVDLEGINETVLLVSMLDTEAVSRRFIATRVDAIFTPQCNFGCEKAVCIAAKKICAPLLLWWLRDRAPLSNGKRSGYAIPRADSLPYPKLSSTSVCHSIRAPISTSKYRIGRNGRANSFTVPTFITLDAFTGNMSLRFRKRSSSTGFYFSPPWDDTGTSYRELIASTHKNRSVDFQLLADWKGSRSDSRNVKGGTHRL